MKQKNILNHLFLLFIFGLTFYATAFSASSGGFQYQALIKDTSGELLINRPVSFRISILRGSDNGEIRYTEEHRVMTSNTGTTSFVIGEGTVINGDFDAIDWENSAYFLKIEADKTGGIDYLLTDITQLKRVPYAKYADKAGSLVVTSPNGQQWEVIADNNGNIISKPHGSLPPSPEYGTVDYIFDGNTIPEITLEVATKDWNTFLQNYDINPANEETVVASFSFTKNGIVTQLDSIGIRLRGNTSRRRPEGNTGELHNPNDPDWHHCHFGLRFKKYRSNQLFSGTDKLSLKWFKDDPAYVRELYGYDLFRRFGVWTAPKVNYCKLNIKIKEDNKVAYFGIYEMIEAIDTQYLEDRAKENKLKSSEGNLWKQGWGSGVPADFVYSSHVENYFGIEDITLDPSTMKTYTYDYKGKKKNFTSASAQMKDFIYNLNTKTGTDFKNWISSVTDVDFFLKTYAANVMLGMWDDYWNNGNNFYFYFDSDGKAYFIPYDYDNSLGTSSIVANSGTQDPLNWGDNAKPLVKKLLEYPEFEEIYKAHINELIDPNNDLFAEERSKDRIKNWHRQIAPYISNDTGEDMLIEDKPAGWGNCPFYRLLSGNNDGGNSGDANYFSTRAKHIPWK